MVENLAGNGVECTRRGVRRRVTLLAASLVAWEPDTSGHPEQRSWAARRAKARAELRSAPFSSNLDAILRR